MAVADILSDIGRGFVTGAKAVGSGVPPVLERTAQVVSGQAPQIDEDARKQQDMLDDAALHAKASILENQLQLGQRYGTLTPDQQQQYIDQITGLYSHPRHAGTLMEKLRQAIHPAGAYAQEPMAPLPDATPPGGTIAKDMMLTAAKRGTHPVPGVHPFQNKDNGKWYQPMYAGDGSVVNEEVPDYVPPPPKQPGGNSPPVPGNQLPADAKGVNGDPIPGEARNASTSFIQRGGVWYQAPQPKPIFKPIRGHIVLIDPKTNLPMRDLGPIAGVKVTSHQTPFLGDDNQMHLMTTYSVTTPQNEKIDVEPNPDDMLPAEENSATSSQATPAKKVNPGSILPKTGAKTPVMGPAIPGSSAWANSKNPLYRADLQDYARAARDTTEKQKIYQQAQGLLNDKNRQTDLELIFAWVRSNVQGAGRMTNTEIQQAVNAGSWGTRLQNAFSMASTGRLSPEIEKQYISDIKRASDVAQKTSDDLRSRLQPGSPPTTQPKVRKFNTATGRLE
jgi:hypothetical protein